MYRKLSSTIASTIPYRHCYSKPRTYKRKVGGRLYGAFSEEKLETALGDIRSRNLTHLRQASVKYGIPHSTLKYKLKEAHAGKPGGPTIFS